MKINKSTAFFVYAVIYSFLAATSTAYPVAMAAFATLLVGLAVGWLSSGPDNSHYVLWEKKNEYKEMGDDIEQLNRLCAKHGATVIMPPQGGKKIKITYEDEVVASPPDLGKPTAVINYKKTSGEHYRAD